MKPLSPVSTMSTLTFCGSLVILRMKYWAHEQLLCGNRQRLNEHSFVGNTIILLSYYRDWPRLVGSGNYTLGMRAGSRWGRNSMLVQFLQLVLPRGRPWRLEVTARTLSFFSEIPMCRLFRPEEPERDWRSEGGGNREEQDDCGWGMMSVCLKKMWLFVAGSEKEKILSVTSEVLIYGL